MENNTNYELKPYSVLVTGATGFIGSRLIAAFEENGIKVKAMSRKEIPDKNNVKYVKADAFNVDELTNALEGIEIAFYLLHSMEGTKEKWEDFANREKTTGSKFFEGCNKCRS